VITLDDFKIITEEFTIDPVERLYLKNRDYTMITDVVRRHPTIETVPGVDIVRTNLIPNNRVKALHWFFRNLNFEDTSVTTVPNDTDTYKIYVREYNGAFTLKNLSFFRVLTQDGVSTFTRVNFRTVTLDGNGTTEFAGTKVFDTEYNIVPWVNAATNPGDPIITVTVPSNTFIEKFSFEFYTEESSRADGSRLLTNIPAFDIVKNDETPFLVASEKISDFVSLEQDTFTQSYSIDLDTSVFRVPDAVENDYYYIQNRFNFSKNPDFDQTFTFFNPIMKDARFYIQGVDLPNISSTTDAYYKYLVPYHRRLSRPIRNIYTYSFSLNPVNVNPSGSLDFSEIQSEKTGIEIKLDENLDSTYRLYIYYTGYQTFEFENGFMKLVY
jgi:5'(3')-deoxyribonucleotidase